MHQNHPGANTNLLSTPQWLTASGQHCGRFTLESSLRSSWQQNQGNPCVGGFGGNAPESKPAAPYGRGQSSASCSSSEIAWGARGPEFKSRRSDQLIQMGP